jgi:hypothetical protein
MVTAETLLSKEPPPGPVHPYQPRTSEIPPSTSDLRDNLSRYHAVPGGLVGPYATSVSMTRWKQNTLPTPLPQKRPALLKHQQHALGEHRTLHLHLVVPSVTAVNKEHREYPARTFNLVGSAFSPFSEFEESGTWRYPNISLGRPNVD